MQINNLSAWESLLSGRTVFIRQLLNNSRFATTPKRINSNITYLTFQTKIHLSVVSYWAVLLNTWCQLLCIRHHLYIMLTCYSIYHRVIVMSHCVLLLSKEKLISLLNKYCLINCSRRKQFCHAASLIMNITLCWAFFSYKINDVLELNASLHGLRWRTSRGTKYAKVVEILLLSIIRN